jgi:hypothetical protein
MYLLKRAGSQPVGDLHHDIPSDRAIPGPLSEGVTLVRSSRVVQLLLAVPLALGVSATLASTASADTGAAAASAAEVVATQPADQPKADPAPPATTPAPSEEPKARDKGRDHGKSHKDCCKVIKVPFKKVVFKEFTHVKVTKVVKKWTKTYKHGHKFYQVTGVHSWFEKSVTKGVVKYTYRWKHGQWVKVDREVVWSKTDSSTFGHHSWKSEPKLVECYEPPTSSVKTYPVRSDYDEQFKGAKVFFKYVKVCKDGHHHGGHDQPNYPKHNDDHALAA